MNSTALITGASRGIGKAIAIKLADLGFDLFLLARNTEALEATAAECAAHNVSVRYLAGDLTDEDYVQRATQAAMDAHGTIDVLVNNAGAMRREVSQEADTGAWRNIMDLNFHAAVYLTRQVLPGMIDRQCGCVINISSIAGRTTNSGGAIYCASKHAINGFSGCLYEDVRDHGIKVSSIMPGFVATDLTGGMGLNAGNMISPGDVADAVAYVVSASPTCCPTEVVLRPQLRP
jgi:NADP-dependent 3-hydroxy acid dehydrogenase YdfG